ncbi:MAG: hypothetical protein DWQ34_02700 [Planctomycetota bacterium]|nr:MAG: hypothetical protein DWQ34_02700 [Planctomycetota bacterium]REK22566.1 MAG: hypothetical protein DWQ41_18955 [Planctomycetota bacterium]REK36012.1 MAG: hypothetical protein DWQ45_10000 [Planctomycetota bacterium]
MCLLLAGVFAVSMVQHALRQRKQVLRDEWQMQAVWLADSAIDRAASQIRVDDEYAGEVWRPGAGATPASDGDEANGVLGRVEIRVEYETGDDEVRLARVQAMADVPDDPEERARVRREVTLELTSGEP